METFGKRIDKITVHMEILLYIETNLKKNVAFIFRMDEIYLRLLNFQFSSVFSIFEERFQIASLMKTNRLA